MSRIANEGSFLPIDLSWSECLRGLINVTSSYIVEPKHGMRHLKASWRVMEEPVLVSREE